MTRPPTFSQKIKADMCEFLLHQQSKYPLEECLRVDLHCHDCNSDIPDELLGRILHLPETWLPTERLLQVLHRNAVDVITITNHNNARSCWSLLERGIEILPGAEFTCTLPDFGASVHVLGYGFSPSEEEELLRLRGDLYRFLAYACERDVPTVLAHPLHFQEGEHPPDLALLDRLGVLFERFEVMNGQRNSWQNLLTAAWVSTLTPEKIDGIAAQSGLRPAEFCRDPYRKAMCGGSDDHMGIFAGSSGSLLHVPGLAEQRRLRPASRLALDAVRAGRVGLYGSFNEEEKLTVAFLDYFCQVALNMKDPGLVRMMLHRGSLQTKVLALLIANGMLELQRHRFTMKFMATFHHALAGKLPSFPGSLMIPRAFRPLRRQVEHIASQSQASSHHLLEAVRTAIPEMFRTLNLILASRVETKFRRLGDGPPVGPRSGEWVRRFELPSHFRSLFGSEPRVEGGDMAAVNLGEFMDGLSFPALVSAVVAGAAYASNAVLFRNRRLLSQLSRSLGRYQPPSRTLWMTDTLSDENVASATLQAILKEVRRKNLPIDFLTCHPSHPQEDHVLVLRPVAEIPIPSCREQPIRLPDLFELLQNFRDGSYDRIVCSTELIMGLLALFLRNCFSVPGYFYVHTDWPGLMEESQRLDRRATDRLRRMLRALYRSYDGLLVSDPENAEWFAGPAMGIPRRKIFDAAYWSDGSFRVMMDTGPEESDSGVRPGHGRQHESAPAGGSLLEELLEIVSQG